MDLRVPASGSLLESFLSGLGHTVAESDGGTRVASVSETQVIEALDALVRGDMEYVILEEGEAFVQAAGSGDGPYALQHRAGAEADLAEVPGGVDAKTVREVLLAYRRGDPAWRGAQTFRDFK